MNASTGAADPPRVLHVIGSLGLGGIETWLVHMLRHHQEFSVKHELLLTKAEVGPYEPEVSALGIPIHRLPLQEGKLGWFKRFERLLLRLGPFDAVHSHGTPHFAAPLLAVAKCVGVPVTIAHSHSARSKGHDYPLKYRIARMIAMIWLRRVASRKVGITEVAIEEIAGPGWRRDPRASVLIYGFDFARYRGAGERAHALRQALGIGSSVPVVGHIGRFDIVKNHTFLLKAFAAAAERVPDAQLVLVGKGPLLELVRSKAETLANRVHFAGTTDDVPAYMALFDLFALPSYSEGLGIVVVEAQAAGTPAIVSEGVPAEAAIVRGAVDYLPLEAGAAAWGDAIAARLTQPAGDPQEWLQQVEDSKFGIRRCIDELDAIYQAELESLRMPR